MGVVDVRREGAHMLPEHPHLTLVDRRPDHPDQIEEPRNLAGQLDTQRGPLRYLSAR